MGRLTSWWHLDDLEAEALLGGLLDGTAPWLGIFVAIMIGAAHAIGPGHGKTLVGAYLIGEHGRVRDAVTVGATVAVMHTASVVVLGVAASAGLRLPGTASIEQPLRLVSSAAVTLVGVVGLSGARRRDHSRSQETPSRVGSRHVAAPAYTTGGPGHGHSGDTSIPRGRPDPAPGHLPDGVVPRSRFAAVAIASSGGLLPSPAALLLLVAAVAAGRVAYGLSLVIAFGVGMAITLTSVGVACVVGRGRIASSSRTSTSPGWRRIASALPVVGNVVLVLGGLALAAAVLGAG